MPSEYLHHHKDFANLLNIVADEMTIEPGLIEKDYWLMHVLYGLKMQGFDFKLKGGTSLSKGYQIIDRFSEDIDIYIKPDRHLNVNENPRSAKDNSIQSRKNYYDWLAKEIKIDGIISISRDTLFDDLNLYRSGGIRLIYQSKTSQVVGVKEGILLEAGFDTVTPDNNLTISSWAYDTAQQNKSITVIDNRAIDIACYHPGYTFVEKLQTIATKHRQEKDGRANRVNFMRQYYDVYCLLGDRQVQDFIGTQAYETHKKTRFPKVDLETPIAQNEAFLLTNPETRKAYEKQYRSTAALYYNGQPDFGELLKRLHQFLDKL